MKNEQSIIRKMNCIYRISLLVVALVLIAGSSSLQAQTRYGLMAKSKLKLANKHYEEFDFAFAANVYRDIISEAKYSSDTLSLRKLAICEKNIGQFGNAELTLAKLTSVPNARVGDFHDYAEMLKINGKFPEALTVYQKIVQLNPNDEMARKYVNDPEFLKEALRDSSLYTVRNSGINSKVSDFAPGFFTSGKVIFSSARGEGVGAGRYYNWNAQPYLNIYVADIQSDSSLSHPVVLNKDVNTRYHEGTMTYDPSSNMMYYTRNNVVSGNVRKAKSGRLFLGIYSTKANPDGTFGDVTKFAHNNKEWSTGHPSITKNGNRMYFVSDRPGGLGGTDIYYCEKAGDAWGEPKNAGAQINSPQDEMFPFALGDSVLYFSSNGQLGLGGFDMYSVNVYQPEATAKNMGYPANSSFDDFGIVLYNDESRGYFSSNRPGGKGDDDIYEFLVHPPDSVNVSGIVVDALSGLPLSNALVTVNNDDGSAIQVLTNNKGEYTMRVPYKPVITLGGEKQDYDPASVELKTKPRGLDYTVPNIAMKKVDYVAIGHVYYDVDGSPAEGAKVRILDLKGMEIGSQIVGADGAYKLVIEKDKKYTIEASKEDYVLLTKDLHGAGNEKSIVTDFRLFKLEKGTVVRLDNIYYDYGKSDIRADAAKELNKLVRILVDNPTMKIELSSYTDARGGDAYNLKLSDARANSAVKYIISQGIDASRLVAKGYGETKLLNRCANDVKCSEEEHQFNRRTEFKILDI